MLRVTSDPEGDKPLRTVVTGAGGAIGQAVVRRLLGEGAAVAALGLKAPNLGCLGIAADVTDEADMVRAVAEATEALGGVDALVAMAGIHVSAPTHELSLADFRNVLDVGAVGMFLSAKAVVTEGQVVAVVATDKIEVELESPVGGVFAKTLVDEGDDVQVGTDVMVIADDQADYESYAQGA